jgi:hypothetical protein
MMMFSPFSSAMRLTTPMPGLRLGALKHTCGGDNCNHPDHGKEKPTHNISGSKDLSTGKLPGGKPSPIDIFKANQERKKRENDGKTQS